MFTFDLNVENSTDYLCVHVLAVVLHVLEWKGCNF